MKKIVAIKTEFYQEELTVNAHELINPNTMSGFHINTFNKTLNPFENFQASKNYMVELSTINNEEINIIQKMDNKNKLIKLKKF